jgi:hypothetical protein
MYGLALRSARSLLVCQLSQVARFDRAARGVLQRLRLPASLQYTINTLFFKRLIVAPRRLISKQHVGGDRVIARTSN